MPRIRTVKPEFFTSDTVTSLPIRARVTWIGLWTHCDDYGRCRNNVKLIKAAVWPLDDVSLRDIEEDLKALLALGLVFNYEAAGKSYIQVTGWAEHQRVDRPSKSPIPAPLSTTNGSYPQGDARDRLASPREELAQEGKGREGKGGRARAREPPAVDNPGSEPPPRTCPKHPKGTSTACGPCKDARLAHQAWEAERRERWRTAARCPQHPDHPDQLAGHCQACRSERLARKDSP
jgi:hypothetical protein